MRLVLLLLVLFPSVAVAQEDVYVGSLPSSAKAEFYQDATQWTGIVVLQNISTTDVFHPEYYGNANSTVEFNGITPYTLPQSGYFAGTIKLTNQSDGTKAWVMGDGVSTDNGAYTIAKLTGDGEYEDTNDVKQQIVINDSSSFTGNLTILGKRWFLGTTIPSSGLTAGCITVEDGQTLTFANQTWSAPKGVAFGKTLKVIGEVGNYITMPEPAELPRVVDAQGIPTSLALTYVEGRLQLARAQAWDKTGRGYTAVEDAIQAFAGAKVTLLEDAVIEVKRLTVNKTFILDSHEHRFSWVDGENQIIISDADRRFKIVSGRTDNGLSSFQNYLLGLKPQAGANEVADCPFLKLTSSAVVNDVLKANFGFFHRANGGVIQPRGDTGQTLKYQIVSASSPDAEDWQLIGESTTAAVEVELPKPAAGDSAVRYFKPRFIFE